ncbi:MAG: ABC transporter permease, partial [Cyanobacteria bacterium P01_C01_bin.73]
MSRTLTPPKPESSNPQASDLAITNEQLQQWKAGADLSAIAANPPGLFSGEFLQETLALTRRLFIQLQRRPSTLVAGIIQPLMWLILFGALFQNVPSDLFGDQVNYGQFLGAGIVVFTAFGGALNAGLPVMFDREFGFLNRLLVAPLASRFSIVVASALFIAAMSFVQTA